MLKAKRKHNGIISKSQSRSFFAAPTQSKVDARPEPKVRQSRFRINKNRPVFRNKPTTYDPSSQKSQINALFAEQMAMTPEQQDAFDAIQYETDDENNPPKPSTKTVKVRDVRTGQKIEKTIEDSGRKLRVLPPPPFPSVSIDFGTKENKQRFLSENAKALQWDQHSILHHTELLDGSAGHPQNLTFTSQIPIFHHNDNLHFQKSVYVPRLNSTTPPAELIKNLEDWVNFQGGGVSDEVKLVLVPQYDNNYGSWALLAENDIPPNTCLGFFPMGMLIQPHYQFWNILTGDTLDNFTAEFYKKLSNNIHGHYIKLFIELCNFWNSPFRPLLDVFPKALPDIPDLLHYPPHFDITDPTTHVLDFTNLPKKSKKVQDEDGTLDLADEIALMTPAEIAQKKKEEEKFDPQAYLHPATHESLQLTKENEFMKFLQIHLFINKTVPKKILRGHQYTPEVHNYIQKIWNARGMQFQTVDPRRPFNAIVPYFDFAHDSPFPNVQFLFDRYGTDMVSMTEKKHKSGIKLDEMYDQALFVVSTQWIKSGDRISITRNNYQPKRFLQDNQGNAVGPLTDHTSLRVGAEIFAAARQSHSMHHILQRSVLRYPHLNANSFAQPDIFYPQTAKFVQSGDVDYNQILPYDTLHSQFANDATQETGHYFISPQFFQNGDRVSNFMDLAGKFFKESLYNRHHFKYANLSEDQKPQLPSKPATNDNNPNIFLSPNSPSEQKWISDDVISPFDPEVDDTILETYHEILSDLSLHLKVSAFTRDITTSLKYPKDPLNPNRLQFEKPIENYGLLGPQDIIKKYSQKDPLDHPETRRKEREQGLFDEDVPFRFGVNHLSPQLEALCYLLGGGAMKIHESDPKTWNLLVKTAKGQFSKHSLQTAVTHGVPILPPPSPFVSERDQLNWSQDYQKKVQDYQKKVYESFTNPLFTKVHKAARCVLMGIIQTLLTTQLPDIRISQDSEMSRTLFAASMRTVGDFHLHHSPLDDIDAIRMQVEEEIQKQLNETDPAKLEASEVKELNKFGKFQSSGNTRGGIRRKESVIYDGRNYGFETPANDDKKDGKEDSKPQWVNDIQKNHPWVNIQENHDENPFKLTPMQHAFVNNQAIIAMQRYENVPNHALQHIFNSMALVTDIHARYFDVDSIVGQKTPLAARMSPVAHVKAHGGLVRF